MKAKELIRILEAVDPESEVMASISGDAESLKSCAKAELVTGECLSVLAVDFVEIYGEEGGCKMSATLNLEQMNVECLGDTDELFDKLYQRRKGVKNPYEESAKITI